MIVYNYTPTGVYRDSEEAEESPLEPGVFLIPAGATSVPPLSASEGFHAVWDGAEWSVVPIPEPVVPTPEPVEPTPDSYESTVEITT
jgi:hypothetical protein